MLHAKEELNGPARKGRIESRHSTKKLEGLGSRSYEFGGEIRMHFSTVDGDTFK